MSLCKRKCIVRGLPLEMGRATNANNRMCQMTQKQRLDQVCSLVLGRLASQTSSHVLQSTDLAPICYDDFSGVYTKHIHKSARGTFFLADCARPGILSPKSAWPCCTALMRTTALTGRSVLLPMERAS